MCHCYNDGAIAGFSVEQCHQLPHMAGVKSRGGFIQDEHVRPGGHRNGNRQPLLLPSGKSLGVHTGNIGQIEFLQQPDDVRSGNRLGESRRHLFPDGGEKELVTRFLHDETTAAQAMGGG